MNQLSTHIHFVRHGLVHNPQGIVYGRLPRFSLSAEGVRQAEGVARFLAQKPVSAIYSGPMLRARQTAKIIAALHPGLSVRESQLLNEVYVPFEGQPVSKVALRNWDLYTGNQPPYESVEDILLRMLQFTKNMRRRHANQEVVAVTHGDPIGFLMLWAQRRPATAANKGPLYEDYLAVGSITTLTFSTAQSDERPTLEYVVPYPGPAPRG